MFPVPCRAVDLVEDGLGEVRVGERRDPTFAFDGAGAGAEPVPTGRLGAELVDRDASLEQLSLQVAEGLMFSRSAVPAGESRAASSAACAQKPVGVGPNWSAAVAISVYSSSVTRMESRFCRPGNT